VSKLAIGGGLATAASVAVGVGLQGTHVSHNVALAFYALAGCMFLASIAAFLSNRNSTAPEASSQMQTSQGAGATNIQISHSEVDLSGVTSPARTAPVSHSIDELHASFSYDDELLVVGMGNANPTIPDATLNLLVPDSLGSITSVDRETRSRHPGSQLHTPEPIGAVSSWIYWAVSGLRLRQRISHLMFFELGDARPGTYPVVLRLVADELPDRAEVQGSFTIPDPQIEAEVDERTEPFSGNASRLGGPPGCRARRTELD